MQKLLALPSEVSSPEFNHILTQSVKHNTLCSAAVQESMKDCCSAADMHRTTVGGWDFSQALLASQVQLSVTQSQTSAFSQDCTWACLGWHWSGDYSPFNLCPSADRHFRTCTALGPDLQWNCWRSPDRGEVLNTYWSFRLLGIQTYWSSLGIIQQLASPNRGNTEWDIYLCYISANSCT